MKVLILMMALMIAGCSNFSEGDCVYVYGVSVDGVDVGDYVKYGDGSHWYLVDGDIRGAYDIGHSITSCDT